MTAALDYEAVDFADLPSFGAVASRSAILPAYPLAETTGRVTAPERTLPINEDAPKPGRPVGQFVRSFIWRDPATIPRRQWPYGRHHIRKFVSATFAPGGVGKSSLVMGEAQAMASGKPLLESNPASASASATGMAKTPSRRPNAAPSPPRCCTTLALMIWRAGCSWGAGAKTR